MKKNTIILLAILALFVNPTWAQYHILSQNDITAKAKINSLSLGSREVRHFVYEYPSVDADGKEVTVSGVIMVPMEIIDGTVPCDGIILYNHPTIGKPEDALSVGGSSLDAVTGILANPLKPNYIVVASDYIGYGSSIDSNVSYICGDTNSRNSLDGLLAAKQLFEDQNIPQGKYLFNAGYSQGGTVSMFASKLTDTEEKYKGIRFDKTFSGGGPLDFEQIYTIYVKRDQCDDLADVVLMLISVNENCHLGIDYKDMFQEPMASKAMEYFTTKRKSVVSEIGVSDLDSLSKVLTPQFMDANSEPAKKLRAALKKISITEGWEPDVTKQYYIEHSRHDNYVPIQSVRGIIPWMNEKGFTQSLVPGKSSLQTNTVVFKLKHQESAIVWAIQSMAAIQFWPVLYYEGEQNRYYHDVVKDMNLMKVIHTLEGLGIDLRKIIKGGGLSRGNLPERFTVFDVVPDIAETLAKVGLTTDDLMEMCEDAGISEADIVMAYLYIETGIDSSAPSDEEAKPYGDVEERIEAPLYLLRNYEQQLVNWFLLAGYDVNYGLWGM